MLYHIFRKLKIIYEANFILVIAIASTTYIHSSFLRSLGTSIPEGVLFALGSLGALSVTLLSPLLFKRFNVERTTTIAGIVNAGAFIVIAMSHNITLSIIAFIFAISSTALIIIGFDIIIESFSQQKEEGEVRGINLALGNLAFLIGPIMAGIIAEQFNLQSVYLFAAVILLLMVLFFHTRFKYFKQHSNYKQKKILSGISKIFKKKNTRDSYMSGFVVEFFFAVWAIFTTVYIHETIGFNWEQIGILFAVMHIPYLILEPIIGNLADKYNKENDLMVTGLIIMAVSFLGVGLLQSSNIILWGLLFIFTRIGASFGQVAHESFFFKKVNKDDSDIISAYRTMAPLALLLGPLIGSIILLFTGYQQLFIIVSLLLLVSVIPASRLQHGKK